MKAPPGVRGHKRNLFVSGLVACWLVAAGTAQAQWFESFDSYAAGSQVAGQGGWQGWDGSAAAGALVSSAQALSKPNSIEITGGSDLVHRYSGYTSGLWIYSARQYIPSSITTGTTYFILLNTYNDGGPYNWSIQTSFNLATGILTEENGTAPNTATIVRDRWVELRYEIDLTANTVSCYYNGVLFSTHAWQTDGVNAIGAVDLYANNVGPVYYDNITLTPPGYAATIMADAPAGYWRLGEMPSYVDPIGIVTNSGSLGASATGTFVDYVRRGQAGAYTGSSAYWFYGGVGRVSITNSEPFNFTGTTPFTLEAWAKPTVTPAGSQRLISNGSSGQGYGFTLYGANQLRMTAFGIVDVTSDAGIPWAVGTWYHLALVRSNTYVFFYTNGVQMGAPKAMANINTTANPLALGATGVGGEPFSGVLDDAAVYTTILTPAQLAAHYDAAINNPAGYPAAVLADQPTGYWQLNEPAGTETGTVIANSGSVGTAGNGAALGPPNVVGGATSALVGDANTAMSFVGGATRSRVEVQQNAALNTPSFTFECWAKLGTWAGAHQSPVSSRHGSPTSGYIFYAAPVGTEARWEFWTGPGWDTVYNPSAVADVIAGQWTHLVGSYDAASRTKVFYVDGQLISGKVNVTVTPNSNSPLRIAGGATEAPVGNYFWNGEVDEVAFYPTVLSPERVQAHYEAALGTSPGMTTMPTVVADPVAQTNWAPYPVTLGCVIAGSLPMQLQWYHVATDGVTTTPVANGTNMILKLDPTAPAQSGSYYLTATNTLGTAASAWAYVEIIPLAAPTITSQPLPRTVYAGASTRFTVQAAGTPPLSYQWKKGGADIAGATNTVLVLTNISAGDAAVYSVGVTNQAGGVVSVGAQLTLRTPPAGSYEEAVVAAGPVAYWRFGEAAGSMTAFDWAGGYDGTVLGGLTAGTPGPSSPAYRGFEANNTAFTFNATDAGVQSSSLGLPGPISVAAWINPNALAGDRAIVGENASWFFKIQNTELRFTTPGILDHNSSGAALQVGAWQHVAVTFEPAAAAGAKFYVNGRFISSVTASALTRGNSLVWIGTNQWAGQVWDGVIDEVAVYNKILSADTIAMMYGMATYSTTTAPLITAEPVSQSVVAGTPATLTVGAEGSFPLGYQWKKDGADITGATTSALTIASAAFADGGSYTVTISNAVGSTNSAAATLTVLAPPTFANLTNDLVMHLKLDTDFMDSSGRVPANDAYGIGPPVLVPGKLGQGVRIVAQTATSTFHYLSVFDSADIQFVETDSFTVSFWLKYTTPFNDLPIIGNAHNSTYNPGWIITENGGRLAWTAETQGGVTVAADPAGGPLLNDGNWHQLAVAFDRTAGVARSYVDGLLVDTRSIAGLGSLYTALNLFIGQDDSGNYPTVFSVAMDATLDLDDIGLWRRALSSYDVLSIYNAAQGANQSFDVYGPVKVTIAQAGADLVVAWQAGTLESNTDLKNPSGWAPVAGASAPTFKVTPGPGSVFYRVRQ